MAALQAIRPILTIADICDLLRISYSQFHESKDALAAIGLLKPVYPDIDRKRRYHGEPFVDWLTDKRQAAHLRDTLQAITGGQGLKVGELFQSRYLRAEDLPRGQRVRVTIERVAIETLHGSRKPVLYFRNKTKGLVINQTRAHSLTTVLASDDTDAWEGCQVTLYTDDITIPDEKTRRPRRVSMIRVDEQPDSARRPRRPGEPETGPVAASDITW